MSRLFNVQDLPIISFGELEQEFYAPEQIEVTEDAEQAAQKIRFEISKTYRQRMMDYVGSKGERPYNLTDDILTNVELHRQADAELSQLRALNLDSISKPMEVVDQYMQAYTDQKMKPYRQSLESMESNRKAYYDSIVAEHAMKIEELKRERFKALEVVRLENEDAFKKLAEISELFHDLEHLEPVYNIRQNPFKVDAKEMDLEEFNRVMQGAYMGLRVIKSGNPLTNAAILLYLPSSYRVNIPYFELIYAICLFLFFKITNPWVLGVLACLFFLSVVVNIFKVYENKTKLRLAYSVFINSVNISSQAEILLYADSRVSVYTTQIKELEVFPINEFADKQCEELDKEIADFKAGSPIDEVNAYRNIIMSSVNMDAYRLMIADVYREYDKLVKDRIQSLQENVNVIWEWLCEFSSNVKKLGEEIKNTTVFTPALSCIEDNYRGLPIGYKEHLLPYENIMFKYSGKNNRRAIMEVLKLYLVNAISHVKEGHLLVQVYDPNGLGQELAEFWDKSLENILSLRTKDFDQLMTELMDINKKNMYDMQTKSITEFNENCLLTGRIPVKYHLAIILSTDFKLEERDEFKAFVEYSTERGIWVWVVQEEPKFEMPVTVERNGSYSYKGLSRSYDTNIDYRVDLGVTMLKTLAEEIQNGRVDILDYEKMYRLKNIPDDKIWTFNTLEGIELHFGNLDGDPNKPRAEVLGDDAVHCLMVGQTGAGKSATINVVLANLLHMYSPEWLNLVMIDFKNVEFNMYTGNCLIPHAAIISGTKDGEYAVSIFQWLLAEMKRRLKLFSKYKCQKIADFNSGVLAGTIPEPIMPRLLNLFDEFQAMFIAVDDRNLDIIKKGITALCKEARAAGIHLWFTSQSMAGTMSEDILEQFKLRVSLSVASQDTSVMVLGNPAGYTELSGKGFLIVNSSGGKESGNRKYRIPYASNAYIKQYLPKLIEYGKCDKDGKSHIHRNASFFDEDKIHTLDEIDQWYNGYEVVRQDNSLLLLGERLVFSDNLLPENVRLGQADGENILFAYYERVDGCNLMNTFMYNLKRRRNALFAGTIGDVEISQLVDFDQFISQPFRPLAHSTKARDLMITLLEELEVRKTEGFSIQNDPIIYWIFLGWDKISGFGQNEDYRVLDTFANLLRNGPEVGIHSIIGTRDTSLLRQIRPLCSHNISSITTEKMSYGIVDSDKASKLKEATALYIYGTNISKFKVYQGTYDEAKIPKRSLELQRSAV